MAFISRQVKLQLPSIIIVDVTAVGVISRVGLLLPPYEACALLPPTLWGTVNDHERVGSRQHNEGI